MATSYNIPIDVVSSPGTNNTYTGIAATFTATDTFAQWDAGYINSSGQLSLAESNSSTTMPAIGLATAAISSSSSGSVLTYGFARDDSWSWTPGGLIYISDTTAGALTQTAPSTSGDQVQVIGIAVTAHIILVQPNLMMLQIQ